MNKFNRKINMNEVVRVKLTDRGRAVWREAGFGYACFKDGFLHIELWHLFEVFGQRIYNGCEIPFDGNDIYFEEAEYMRIEEDERIYCGNVSCQYNHVMECIGGITDSSRCSKHEE